MKEKKNEIVSAVTGQSLLQDACIIIDQAQALAYRQVNETLIKRNWLLGMRIQHEVLKDKRAEYGDQVVKNLSKSLTEKYGRGFKKSNLYLFIAFYQGHPNFFQSVTGKFLEITDDEIFQSVTGKSQDDVQSNILQSLTAKSPIRLSWTHYSIIQQENNEEARGWYEQEAANL